MSYDLIIQTITALGTTATAFGVWFAWDNSKKYKEELNLLKESLENQNKELKANHDWNRNQIKYNHLNKKPEANFTRPQKGI